MIDFPANPTLGQQFTAAGVTWTWDGAKWTSGGQSVAYLPLAGGTMLGPIVLAADPAAALQPATKQYADANYSGFVNKFRNGTFDVWQRGSVAAPAGGGVYTADGWVVSPVGATCSVGQSTTKIGRSLTSLALNSAAGLTDVILWQKIESSVSAPLAGQIATFQAVIYNNTASPVTPTLRTAYPTAQDNFSTTTNDLPATNLQTIAAGATAKVAYTFPVSPNAVLGYTALIDFGGALNVASRYILVSDADIRVTPGWPVGLCANPPPPELRHVQAERAFCQRYFQVGQMGFQSYVNSTAGVYASQPYPVQMRAEPTKTITTNNCSNVGTPTLVQLGPPGMGLTLSATSTGAANYTLNVYYTANAEL